MWKKQPHNECTKQTGSEDYVAAHTILQSLHLAYVSACMPVHPPHARQYALEALRRHGPLKGSWLAIKRICRCHPWGGCGYDPVP